MPSDHTTPKEPESTYVALHDTAAERPRSPGRSWSSSSICVTVVVAAIAVAAGAALYCNQLHEAQPNEWLVVVENGTMVRGGIGMRHLATFGQQVVRFPSSIQRVKFKAQQVTREMQGIEVEGFAIWTVYRDGDGPFRAYRNLDGMSRSGLQATNTNMAAMAESVIRAQVANLNINEVITGRDTMRKKLTGSMMEVVKGWGIWLETVEITDVKILSSSLFSNLQTKFREESRHAAEQHRLEVQQKLDLKKEQTELEVAKTRASARREKAVFEAEQSAAELQEQEATAAKRQELALQQHSREHELKMRKMEDDAKLKAAKTEHQMKEAERAAEAKLALQAKVLKLEQTMTPLNVQSAQLTALKEIYAKLPLREVKLVHVANNAGGNSTQGMDAMLPGMAALQGMQGV